MDSTEDRPSLVAQGKDKQPVPYSDAPSPVRAVLNRPWPSPVLIPPDSPSRKYRTPVATAKDIGDPISPEEIAALEDKESDDANARFYKAMARTDVFMRNYIHEHGSLYMDENDGCMFDNSAQVEEIRCKSVTAEEMEAKIIKREATRQETYLSELALVSFNKRKKVKFELCETLLSNSFWQNRDSFVHLNFIAKRKDKKTLFFAEIEYCGEAGEEIPRVRCCVPLDSSCEGGYHYYCVDPPGHGYRKSLDFTRCYACTEFLKHPANGSTYTGGHDHRKRMYL
ncbi:uncharacterized protein [Triticum aestivum]|uniref:uncharacterized protein n=1 Tax=Triticum aestivum TaxID=4565 RepID=UPI001D003F24|nr:uncharacterized protein LOC123093890 [Triticum aestivum]